MYLLTLSYLTLVRKLFVKKIRWMFPVVVTITLASSLAISADLNAAPLTGTIKFNQKITPRPCILSSGKHFSKSFQDFSKLEILTAGHNYERIDVDSHELPLAEGFVAGFAITCPNSVTSVKVKAIYTDAGFIPGKPILKLDGTGKGVALWIYPVDQIEDGNVYWKPNDVHSFKIDEKDGGVVKLKAIPYPFYNSKDEIHAGDYTGTINLEFDFVGA